MKPTHNPSGGLPAAAAIRALRLKRRHSPLELCQPWEYAVPNDPERLSVHRSQRAAALEILSDRSLISAAVFGGNRSGKTTICLWLCVVWALGRQHPVVRRWAEAWDLPLTCVPDRPGSVVIGTQTHTDSIKQDGARQTVEALIPGAHQWWNYNAPNEARVEIYTPRGTGAILFKSFERGREGWQSFKADLIMVDEEILRDDVEGIWTEMLMRILDKRGRILYSMTGLSGYTWSHAKFIANPQPGYKHVILRTDDNPHIPPDFLRAIYAGLTPEQVSARRNGLFTPLTGLVFPGFGRAIVSHADAKPPEGLDVDHFTWQDFGFEHPSVCLWGWVDERGPWPVARVYRELRRTRRTQDQWARDVAWWSGYDVGGDDEDHGQALGEGRPSTPTVLNIGSGDAASPGHLRALTELGIQCRRVVKDRKKGTDLLRTAIAMDRVKFSEVLRPTIAEFQTMAYQPGKDEPPDGNDHGVDAARYGVRGLAGVLDLWAELGERNPSGEEA